MSFLSDLNPSQREAVKNLEGPVIIVAGAGSGKTRVLTYRIARLVQVGVPAYQILALTFTNKAAKEMKERIVQLVGSSSKSIWMGTFHSMFARVLRLESEKLGYGKNFTIYDEQDSLRVVKNVMNAQGISLQQFNPQAIRSRISSAKNRLLGPEEFASQVVDQFDEVSAKVFARYQKLMKRNNAMDFDDLLVLPIHLFEQNKKILNDYQERFRFVLVDEYQDTNKAQYVLLKQLAAKYKNICVVGDDAQSIYAFRGAEIRNILDYQVDYPEAKLFRLEQNYRSTKTILAIADSVIKNNVDQIPKNLWTDNQTGEPITILECADDKDEGIQIAQRILEDIYRLKLDFKDFALLYRTNAQSRSLEDALRKNGIPYTIVGGIEFYQRKEVKDVLAFLRVLTNPLDNESFLRTLNCPNRGIGDVTVERLQAFAERKGLTLLDAVDHAAEIPHLGARTREALLWVGDFFKRHRHLKTIMSMSELSRTMVDELGILGQFKEEGTPDAISRWENVQELLSAISEFSSERPGASLEDFLEEVSLVSDIDSWDDAHNAVTLMTLHSAKGLEFPVAFITGLEEGLLPLFTTVLSNKELEEERRLFYVGITRAMRNLSLSFAGVRYRYGDVTYPSPSRFLDEIGNERIQRITSEKPSSFSGDEFSGTRRRNRRVRAEESSDYFSDPMPDYENATDTVQGFQVGMTVHHDVFGKGRIVSLSGAGESMKASVEFSSAGRKQLLLKYARLRVV
ncbi:MAG: UvrD-helicase domain-containing protein [Bacteroidota bacterium]